MQMYQCLQVYYGVYGHKCQAPGEQQCILALPLHNIPSRLWLVGICRNSMIAHDQFHRLAATTSLKAVYFLPACELVHDVDTS